MVEKWTLAARMMSASFSAGAFRPLVDGFQDSLGHLGGRGVGEGGGDDELPGRLQVAPDLLGEAIGLAGTGRGGDKEALHRLPPARVCSR